VCHHYVGMHALHLIELIVVHHKRGHDHVIQGVDCVTAILFLVGSDWK
jgi:hypothetical protein